MASEMSMSTVSATDAGSFEKEDNAGKEFDPQPSSVGEVFFASLKIIIGIVGMIGNFTVCLVVIRLRFQRVHILITTQAIVDFLSSLFLVLLTFTDIFPLTTPGNNGLAYLYCFFWYSHMCLFFIFAVSTFNLVAVSLERYIAVLHPIWYSQNFSRDKALVFAAAAWVLGPIMQIIIAIITTDVQNGQCAYLYNFPILLAAMGVLLFLWEFFIPCIIMGFCFTRISIKLKQQSKRVAASDVSTVSAIQTVSTAVSAGTSNNGDSSNTRNAEEHQRAENQQDRSSSSSSKRNRNVTKTLIIVFAAYVICWSADHFLFLQYNLGGQIDFNGAFYGFAVSMAMLNSACNPFVYALRYQQYRKELKEMCLACKGGRIG